MSKYNSRKTTVDGFTFDSKKEAKRYLELKQMEKDGLIHKLQLQVPFELIPPFEIEIDGREEGWSILLTSSITSIMLKL